MIAGPAPRFRHVIACLTLASCQGVPEPIDQGLESLGGWSRLPELATASYRLFSSSDRSTSRYPLVDPDNKDFNNFISVCGARPATLLQETDRSSACDPGVEGYLVAADDSGPGFVSRIWLTAASPLGTGFSFEDETLRVYVDDLPTPAYEGRLADWRTGRAGPPFVPPFTTETSGAVVSYAPISYGTRLRILLDGLQPLKLYYYQIGLQTSPPTASFRRDAVDAGELAALGAALRGGARQASDAIILRDDVLALPPGSRTVALDHRGRGTIHMLQLSFDDLRLHRGAPEGREQAQIGLDDLRSLGLIVEWDDRPQRAIELSLAAFFGCHQTIASFDTLPLQAERSGGQLRLTSYLPMPFSSRARVTLSNGGARPIAARVRIEASRRLPAADWGYLHAGWHRELAPVPSDARYPVAEVVGPGKYVGTMMFLRGRPGSQTLAPHPLNFLEGDDEETVDDGPANRGTGTEDYFNGGFYFSAGTYSHPFSALINKEQDDAGATAALAAVRWHILGDAISFQRQFRLRLEYGANRPETALDYSSVSYYYAR